MPIDPNIALGVKPIQLADPLAQYGRISAIQNAQAQNQLAQLQMQKAQREQDVTNALNAAFQTGFDPTTGQVAENKLVGSLATGGFGAEIPGVLKRLRESERLRGQISKEQQDLIKIKLANSKDLYQQALASADPGAAMLSIHQGVHADPDLGPWLKSMGSTAELGAKSIQEAIAKGPDAVKQMLMGSIVSVDKLMPTLGTVDTGPFQVLTKRDPITGKAIVTDRFAKGMTPGEAERIRLETEQKGINERRLQLAEQQAARAMDPVFQEMMAAARVRGMETTKSDVKAVEILPKLVATAEDGITLIDELVGKRDAKGNLLKGAKPHPGFEAAVGATWLPGARFVPGTDAASFDARFQQINSQSFLSAFESLRGGGHISNAEGQKATSAVNRMSLAQNEKEFIAAAMDVQDVLRKGAERAQARVAKIKTPGASAPSVGAVVDGYKFKGGNPADPASWEKQ